MHNRPLIALPVLIVPVPFSKWIHAQFLCRNADVHTTHAGCTD